MAYNVVVIHAGHTRGGGARGSGFEESAVARQFVPILFEAFRKVGQNVVDVTDNVSTTQSANLSRLVSASNAVPGNELNISLHFNSSSDPSSNGVETLYYDQLGLSDKVSAAISKASGLRLRDSKVRKDLAVLNGTHAPAILIELAFISNASDMKKFFDNMQAIANAIVQAVTGVTVSGGGGNPVIGKQNIIQTGAFSPYEVPDVAGAMKSLNMTGKFTLKGDGLTFVVTEPTSDTQLKAMKEYLDRKGWWYEVK
ncbi:N-acetylmuramoyl-L-alanine amidase [Bacillus cereus]|uniref:N-acetylmuramoyl-L-alanine amidase n=1 Tax=Bacillus cereus TaxID=1396 RepID=UPI00019FE504|nr:N-acetylmuramoyl-L-alanine amidase [Bacillus cereus]EEK53332.1 N-acetylmuramoyl-L-alanine amidase [Bacillus cereus BGSC 6E1]